MRSVSEIEEALLALDHLIKLESKELEYSFVKVHPRLVNNNNKLIVKGFEDLLQRDSFLVEMY